MKIKLLSFFLCLLFLTGCGSVMTTRNAMLQIEKGMTKREVAALLGQPDYRRFDSDWEEWEYRKVYDVLIIRLEDDKVVGMDSFNTDELHKQQAPVYPLPPEAVYPPRPSSLDDPRFQALYNKVAKEPFKDDQLKVLAAGAVNKRFTCEQCIKLMSIYPFDDDRLKVFDIIFPHIVDGENYQTIIDSLDFISSQQKVEKKFERYRRER